MNMRFKAVISCICAQDIVATRKYAQESRIRDYEFPGIYFLWNQ